MRGMTRWRVCTHLPHHSRYHWHVFTGEGLHYDLACPKCAKGEADWHSVSEEEFRRIEEAGYLGGITGQPEVKRAPSGQAFVHETARWEEIDSGTVKAVAPLAESWLLLTATGELVELDVVGKTMQQIASVGDTLDLTLHLGLCVSEDGSLVVAFETRGRKGLVLDRHTGKHLLPLLRGEGYTEMTPFSVAFVVHQERTLLVHATDWNRLDITDPRTGELLTPRGPTSYKQGETCPEHYMDYFHGSLYPSPEGTWIADDGWVWNPIGAVLWWSLTRWLGGSVWECEDAAPSPCGRGGFWGGPICWIDDTTLAVWGYGSDDSHLLPAVRLFDVASGQEKGWFPGPPTSRAERDIYDPTVSFQTGWMVYDEHLFVCSAEHGVSVWDVGTGAWLLEDPSFFPVAYQPGTRSFLTPLPDGAFQLSRLIDPVL